MTSSKMKACKKILLVAMKYDYGDEKRGLALDYYYFEEPLKNLGYTVISYDFMGICKEKGKDKMNALLLELVQNEQPDIVFVVPFTDQFKPSTIDAITSITTSVAYFFDDAWRVEYSRFWSKHFTFVTTSDVNGVKKWESQGCTNFIYSPFGSNQRIFRKENTVFHYDVTFVGGYHPYRAWIIRQLKEAGINVQAFGYGWPSGRLDFEEMVAIFNQSKINLNLSNNEFFNLHYLFTAKNGLKNTGRLILLGLRNAFKKELKTKEMVKARHFEISACGGFQLSYGVEGLETHFRIGEELVTYDSIGSLIEKVKYYLVHETERSSIADKGYQRALADHTMDMRLKKLIDTIWQQRLGNMLTIN
jgi:spore maturation protein CgeB